MRCIDFGLVRNLDAHPTAEGFHGSDHRLVVFDCIWGRKRLRVGLWNAQRDRDRAEVAATVLDLFALHELDALALTEANDYLLELRKLRAVRLLAYTAHPGQAETVILVRDGLDCSSSWCMRLTQRGWITSRGGRTPPKYMPTTLLAGWLRLAVLHDAPSTPVRHGRIIGPVRRVASKVASRRRVRTFARRRPRAQSVLIVGDWNNTPHERGLYSPRWLARTGRLRIVATQQGTHR